MNPINPLSVALSLNAINGLERLLKSVNTGGPRLSVPPNLHSEFLARAETVLVEGGALKPSQATLASIDRATHAYLFRFPGDPEQFSRLIVPPNRVSSALEIKPVNGYKTPLIVALYKTLPDFDRPLTGYFLRLSALFGHVTPDAYGEVQEITADNVPHQALMALLGATATLASVPAPEEKPAPKNRRTPSKPNS
jgi:hypothetical protein